MFLSHIDVSLSLCLSLSLKAMKTMSFFSQGEAKKQKASSNYDFRIQQKLWLRLVTA